MKELKPQLCYLAFKGFFYETFTKNLLKNMRRLN